MSYCNPCVFLILGLSEENQSLKLLDLSQQHVVLETEGLITGLSLALSEVKVVYKILYDSLYQINSDILIKFNTKQLEFCILCHLYCTDFKS